jgi:peptidoglycan hydrolase-like protein with peptidoglycan-binding domain
MGIQVRLAGALIVGGAVFAVGCAQSGAAAGAAKTPVRTGSAAATTASAGPSTTPVSAGPATVRPVASRAPGTTATPGAPAAASHRRTLEFGDRNADVKALQERLRALHYDPGTADGRYGQTTQLALFAFEKVNRLKLTGIVGAGVWKALDAPKTPKPLLRDSARERVEIDLARQLLYVYRGGQVVLISHVSSGGGYRYCAKDPGSDTPRCRYAVTPAGDYLTGRRVGGWDTGPLGGLYKPVYFNGGIAVHGYPSVPLEPVSHGCVRVPMHTADVFQELVGDGVLVHVRGAR